jgi:hypothetical protein
MSLQITESQAWALVAMQRILGENEMLRQQVAELRAEAAKREEEGSE